MVDVPGEKFLTRLMELGAQAIGSSLAPWQIKRLAKAQAEAGRATRLLEAQTEEDLKLIQSGAARVVDGAVVPTQTTNALPDQAEAARLVEIAHAASDADVARRLLNLASIIEIARDEGEGVKDEAVADKPVDPDWFVRWRLSAQEVGDELMQQLWARLLTGEIQSPGAFSLRTLQTLSQMTKDDADFIARLATYRIDNMIFRPEGEKGFPYPEFNDLLRLEELGMTSGISSMGLIMEYQSSVEGKFLRAVVGGEWMLLVQEDDASKTLTIPNYRLSSQFMELSRLCKAEANIDYLRGVGGVLKKQGFKVGLSRYQPQPNGMLSYTIEKVEWL